MLTQLTSQNPKLEDGGGNLARLMTSLCYNARRSYMLPCTEYKDPLQTLRPYNLAHRGSCGEFPEHTAASYQRAIQEGADFLEADIVTTKDGVLICNHDQYLDKTSNIAEHKEFANRKKTYEIQGVCITGFFIIDFTWKELQKLRAKQRFSFRDQQYNEFICVALNASRVVGLYPEIKDPVFINKHVKWPNGKRFEDVFVDTLKKFGYNGSYMSENWLKQPCFVQSFAPSSLIYISRQTQLPKFLLIGTTTELTQDTNQTFAEITSDKYFDYINKYIVGIAPFKDTVVPVLNNYLQVPTDLVNRAHAHNLQVHPYSF